MNCIINPRNIVAFTLILFVALILCGSVIAQEKNKIDVKAAQHTLSVPEIIVPAFNPAEALKTIKIDTTELKAQIEQITAKRKELAEFERHFKAVLKLKRQENLK